MNALNISHLSKEAQELILAQMAQIPQESFELLDETETAYKDFVDTALPISIGLIDHELMLLVNIAGKPYGLKMAPEGGKKIAFALIEVADTATRTQNKRLLRMCTTELMMASLALHRACHVEVGPGNPEAVFDALNSHTGEAFKFYEEVDAEILDRLLGRILEIQSKYGPQVIDMFKSLNPDDDE